MTLDQFLTIALEPAHRRRSGQHFANQLSMHRYDLFQGLQYADLDPYYRDDRIWEAVEWVKNNWNSST